MQTQMNIIDENEVAVKFTGSILIARPEMNKFKKQLEDLISEYSL